MRRLTIVALALALGACSKGSSEPAAPKVAAGAEHIDCALGAGTRFVRDCAIERSREGGIYKMIVRHPDGGFRRFEVGADNTIAASDGADLPQVILNGTVAEVTVGGDRYRIPLEARAPAGTDAAKP
ncbi:MAG: hypothetical protein JWQ16_3156 [Novosphingobium sp.]|nr:hypothetical protein [Novosphingobium sp.]